MKVDSVTTVRLDEDELKEAVKQYVERKRLGDEGWPSFNADTCSFIV